MKPNLQAVSQVQREAGKLIKAQVEIGCYTLSLASVREAVERQCKELQEAVIGSQTRQARQERLEAEGHLTRGLALVSTEATSIQDIGEKKKGAPQLAEASREAQRLLARVRERNRLIAEISQSAKAQMEQVDVSDLEQRAEEFESARQRHDHDLEDQRKRLVGVVEGRKREFVDRVRALHGAWAAARPREGAAVDKAQIFCTLDEVAEQAAAAATDARALQADCEAGGVEGIDLEEVERLAAEVAEERTAWQRYEDFCKERDALFKTPWMAVRERARNEIEDFLHKWKRALGARGLAGRGVVDRTIQDDLERYEAINPHLKFIQGFAWDEGHWARLFKMIGMPRQDLMRVTLLDFLERTDKLTACADEIRAMDARAQAEAGLRKALAELKDWGFQRTFSLLEHDIASQGKTTHLIREWKDLMTEVGDMQVRHGPLWSGSRWRAGAKATTGRQFKIPTRAPVPTGPRGIAEAVAVLRRLGHQGRGRLVGRAPVRAVGGAAAAERHPAPVGVPGAHLQPRRAPRGAGALLQGRPRLPGPDGDRGARPERQEPRGPPGPQRLAQGYGHAAGALPKGADGVPRGAPEPLPALLLYRGRRPAGDPEPVAEPPGHPDAPQEALRGHLLRGP